LKETFTLLTINALHTVFGFVLYTFALWGIIFIVTGITGSALAIFILSLLIVNAFRIFKGDDSNELLLQLDKKKVQFIVGSHVMLHGIILIVQLLSLALHLGALKKISRESNGGS
tara:strand:+ start:1569 stop:1913 length:345 start_codon:yes stop_codon:yes gene_type:complete